MEILKEGSKAPDFIAKDQSGKTIKLSDYAGSKVILYFYPKDNTPGCTVEACNLRDNYQELLNKGIKIIGISADNETSHQNFTEKFSLPFPLIPDTEKNIISAYGVWGEKKFMGRTYMGIHRITFVIDENGIIQKIFTKVDTKNHTNQILTELK
ncbi:MAG: thioredoxin-dependent thiol peroxidase [Bacteroidetes bacterium]|nr:thioredoxin-dependent thiol peroxidase [Bacteroidota bacterium]